LNRLAGCIDRGLEVSRDALEHVGRYAQHLQAVDATLRPSDAVTAEERKAQFLSLQEAWQSSMDPVHQHFAKIMSSFEPGVFVGDEAADFPTDNLDLERWFKGPKGHERRIHGHRHAGVRIVRQGPTLMLALDAHVHHEAPFTVEDLTPYRLAGIPQSQQEAVERGKIMRQARSRKKRPELLADLEKRYLKAP
jgi:hypothetical protein